MSSLIDTMKCIVDQRKGLQERLEIMVLEQNPAILTPMSISVSNALVTSSTSGNWRDTYAPFGPSMLNPHNTGPTTADSNINAAQTPQTVAFPLWSLFSLNFVGHTIAQTSASGMQKFVQDNPFFSRGTCK